MSKKKLEFDSTRANDCRLRGNEMYSKKEYEKAIKLYTVATKLYEPTHDNVKKCHSNSYKNMNII